MLGPIRAMFLGYSIDRYRPSDGTPNAATVAVTTGRVSLSPCTALWSMKIKSNILELSSATLPAVKDTVAALGVPSHGLWRNVLTRL
jgi:hypothetical protein